MLRASRNAPYEQLFVLGSWVCKTCRLGSKKAALPEPWSSSQILSNQCSFLDSTESQQRGTNPAQHRIFLLQLPGAPAVLLPYPHRAAQHPSCCSILPFGAAKTHPCGSAATAGAVPWCHGDVGAMGTSASRHGHAHDTLVTGGEHRSGARSVSMARRIVPPHSHRDLRPGRASTAILENFRSLWVALGWAPSCPRQGRLGVHPYTLGLAV